MKKSSTQFIKEIIHSGTLQEKKELFGFDSKDNEDKILLKFKLFARGCYSRYFTDPSCAEHDVTIRNYIKSYRGKVNGGIEIAFRGFAKTALLKLFVVFVILNDKDHYRKYLKVLSRDLGNSKQFVTDVYNMIVEVKEIYPDTFEKQTDKKIEETMKTFTTSFGLKLSSGTVGQTQRGHLQDAFRPDWVIFEDIEDRESISSIAITNAIILKVDEAIQGLSFDGNWVANANYISDVGVVQDLIDRKGVNVHIVPIFDKNGNPTWKRYTSEKIEQLKANTHDWYGEYMCDPSRTGDKFFDAERVQKDLENARDPESKSGDVRYWGKYQPNHRYGGALDLSDGVGKDSCAGAFFNFATGELIATADDNETAPDLFTYEMVRVGGEFGNCILAPEANNTCGGIAIRVLKEREYPRIYRKEITDTVGNVVSNKLGWYTNSKTKPDMFWEFRKDYNDGFIKIYDERVLREMKMFNKMDLKDSRASGVTRHFDLLTAVVIAWQMRDKAEHGEAVKDFYKNLKSTAKKKRKVAT